MSDESLAKALSGIAAAQDSLLVTHGLRPGLAVGIAMIPRGSRAQLRVLVSGCAFTFATAFVGAGTPPELPRF